jgi:hypothetical protein
MTARQPPVPGLPPSELKARILSAAKAQPSVTRRTQVVRGAIFLIASVAAALVIFFAMGGIRVTGRPLGLIAGTSLGTGFVAAVCAWAALGRSKSMMGRPTAWLVGAALAGPLALLAWKIGYSAQFDHGLDAWPGRIGYRCLKLSLGMGVIPLVAMMFVRRGTDPTHPRTLGFAMGMALGLCTDELVDLWCPVAYVPHLLIGHVLPAVLLGILGAILGWRLLPPSGVRRKS